MLYMRSFVWFALCVGLLVHGGCVAAQDDQSDIASMLVTSRGLLPSRGLMTIVVTHSDQKTGATNDVFYGVLEFSEYLTKITIPRRGRITFTVEGVPTWYDSKSITVVPEELLHGESQLLITVRGYTGPWDVQDLADEERLVELQSFEGIDVEVVDADYLVF